MYSLFSDRSINKLFYKILDASVDWPRGVVRRGGRTTIDSPGPVCVHLTNPRNKVLTIPGRAGSFPAVCAETLWVLGGRSDLELIKYFLPRAVEFSDNQIDWRAGYGPRLRGAYKGFPDQVALVVRELKQDPNSRRAVMTLLDPALDYLALATGTKDFPCTQSLSFMVREGRLDLTVFIRSNDLIWGWSHINVFEFCVLQELVSSITKIPLGEFYVISNSLHIYEDLAKRIATISSKERFDVYDYCSGQTPTEYTTLKETDEALSLVLESLDRSRNGTFPKEEWIKQSWLSADLVADLGLCSLSFSFARDIDTVLEALPSVTDTAFKINLLEYIARTTKVNSKEFLDYIEKFPLPVQRYILEESKTKTPDKAGIVETGLN